PFVRRFSFICDRSRGSAASCAINESLFATAPPVRTAAKPKLIFFFAHGSRLSLRFVQTTGDTMLSTTQTIIVTGGTSGIGYALVQRLHRRGHRLIVLSRSAQKLADLKVKLPGVDTIAVDLS